MAPVARGEVRLDVGRKPLLYGRTRGGARFGAFVSLERVLGASDTYKVTGVSVVVSIDKIEDGDAFVALDIERNATSYSFLAESSPGVVDLAGDLRGLVVRAR